MFLSRDPGKRPLFFPYPGKKIFAGNCQIYSEVNRSNWFKFVYGYDEILQHPSTLMGWISGSAARQVSGGFRYKKFRENICFFKLFFSFTKYYYLVLFWQGPQQDFESPESWPGWVGRVFFFNNIGKLYFPVVILIRIFFKSQIYGNFD